MDRRQELENIIIGTLLESKGDVNYYDDCRCAITEDMFLDEDNRRIYALIVEMNRNGHKDTDPCSIFEVYGAEVLDIMPHMYEMCTEWSMIYKKWYYNEKQWIGSELCGVEPKYTDVCFSDFVGWFVKLVYDEKRESGSHEGGRSAAAA